MQRNREEDIGALLELFGRRPLGSSKFAHDCLHSPLLDLSASRPRAQALISCLARLWWSGRTIILVRLLQLLHSSHSTLEIATVKGLRGHLRGRLQAHAYPYATQPIAIMPHSDWDGFCLAATV